MTALRDRGFLSQSSDAGLEKKLETPTVLYAGFDPTAESLHIGNLLQIMLLAQFQRHGHTPIALVGGATAMIGDPSGKSAERVQLEEKTILRNQEGIKRQLQQFLDFENGDNKAILVNNHDWISKFSFIDFLRDVGKHFRVGEMMGKESVRKRLQSDAGMSFTEFSYQTIQGYDFCHLNREYNCTLQVGGDDQWGNIIAGIDLTRKMTDTPVYGMTSPLLTTATGQKFGKTEAGTIWLDSQKTTPYDFYQYWIRVDDRDVINLLYRFTYMPIEQILELEKCVKNEPEKRQAQNVLAQEVTRMVHGDHAVEMAQKAAKVLFGQEITGMTDADLTSIFSDVPSTELQRDRLVEGIPLLDVICETKLCNSRGEAKKLIKSGGAYINNKRADAIDITLKPEALASETVMVLRSGKKKYHLVKFN
ncbi:MAG: tyrosine--tRNA ligase [Phycisphaerae bacterium]|nr:tyrosine--tRNA ligase [Phycisphaerae bacterium]